MGRRGLEVAMVEPGSIADQLAIGAGDRLVAINGEPVRDLIDLIFLESEERLTVEAHRPDGEVLLFDIEKNYDQSLGLDFGESNFGRIINCSNKCVFCFVDRLPPGMRKTLYVKDDDYRLSFWAGNYITLTNTSEVELKRITRQRLSPLYISVHTTNPELRRHMLGHPRAGLIMRQLHALARAGIEMHTQVVLCPGVNDGRELVRTVEDLAGLWPMVNSLAVVPVGLTKYGRPEEGLRPVTPGEARTTVEWVELAQDRFLHQHGSPFVYASDEFYQLSGVPVPRKDRYNGFPQVQNGVGLVRLFLDEWDELKINLPPALPCRRAVVATGVLGEQLLRPVVDRLGKIDGLNVALRIINNRFFGEQVTVAGLLTGRDVLSQLEKEAASFDLLVIPEIMLKEGESLFLDDFTLDELAGSLGVPVAAVEGPRQLFEVLQTGPAAAARFGGHDSPD